MEKYYISKSGYEKLYEDFLNVDKEINDVNRKMGESVKRDNDLRENPEFMELRVKAMYELPGKKNELWLKYESAVIIEEMDEYKNFDGEIVVIGAKVTLNFAGDKEIYIILGNDEGDLKKGILSCQAPISKAIIGKKVGDIVEFNHSQIEILEVKLI